jgi:hypothetical protein
MMTKAQAKKIKQQLLGLGWDINCKQAKSANLARLLVDKGMRYARITKADYAEFFKSRRINPTWR